jgi:hypothetical protein
MSCDEAMRWHGGGGGAERGEGLHLALRLDGRAQAWHGTVRRVIANLIAHRGGDTQGSQPSFIARDAL